MDRVPPSDLDLPSSNLGLVICGLNSNSISASTGAAVPSEGVGDTGTNTNTNTSTTTATNVSPWRGAGVRNYYAAAVVVKESSGSGRLHLPSRLRST